jgi:hypothetical protein
MNRRHAGVRLSGLARLRLWLLAAALLGPAGCSEPLTRPQAADEPERDRYEVQTIGAITDVGNARPTPLGGVGIVVGLDGPGEAQPEHRTMLEAELRKMGVRDAREWATRPDAAVVFVTAMMPSGGGKGDAIDVDVALTPNSKATNLRGGYLMECQLYNYDYTQNLSPNTDRPQMMLRGHPVAKARGPVLVGFGEGDEPLRVKRGRVWSGGRLGVNWPLTLVLKPDNQTPTWAIQVADRVNNAFAGGTAVARAHDPLAIPLQVPPQYRLNQQHFLRVVRAIPLYDVADLPDDRPDNRSYRRRLTDDLLDPAHTISAALRLEALGPTAIPALKRGLESPDKLVRFASAQSLAYLNSPSAADELARIVRTEPVMRALALTALASLDESASESRLQELLTTSADDETRYGAFRALRARNERNVLVEGDYLNSSFWLHRVAPKTVPLVHVSTSHRAEIVLFGTEPTLQPPFAFHTADFTITAVAEDEYCTVNRYPVASGPMKKQCKSLRVAEVLQAMAELGGTYPEVVELLDQANRCQCLSCRLRFDALPLNTSVFDLDKAGKGQLDLLDATPDLETSTLFSTGRAAPPTQSAPGPGAGE